MKCEGHYSRRNMKMLGFLLVIVLLKKCSALYYTYQDGLTITYDVVLVSKCRTEADRVRSILGIGLSDCVRECGLRPHCGSLNYKRQMLMCNLLTTPNGGNIESGLRDGICFSVTDIKIEKKPCGNCSYGQVCDRRLKDCKYGECLNASISNGVVLGNQNEVGKRIRYKCNHGYRDMNGIESAVCQENGVWNATANCTRDCGNPPPIANGNIVLNTGTMYMNTAAVTCDTSFKASTNSITCTASGSWGMAKCNDCYIDTVRNYSGMKNITVTGYACERWDDHIGTHGTDAQHIPESSLSEIENYCRNPTNNNHWPLWCFSTKPDIEWEVCDIQQC